MADERLEAEPHSVAVGRCAADGLRLAQQVLVDVQRLFHTADYAHLSRFEAGGRSQFAWRAAGDVAHRGVEVLFAVIPDLTRHG